MYGLEAIAAHNGWAVSVVGITIVFTSLVLLSFAIGQIHKVLGLWENRKTIQLFQKKPTGRMPVESLVLTHTQKESARQFQLLAKSLEHPLSLSKLLNLATVSGIDKPHSSLNILLETGIIIADEQGYFIWKTDRYSGLMSKKTR